MEEETLALIYCNLKATQFVSDNTVRIMRTYVFRPSSSTCLNEFRNLYCVPVEHREVSGETNRIPDDRGAAQPLPGQHDAHEVSVFSRKNYNWKENCVLNGASPY